MAKTEIQKVDTAIQTVEQKSPIVQAAEFLQKDDGIDVDKLEKLFEIQERWEANEARKAYHQAMADFKANPPEILKDKKVSFKNNDQTTTSYSHATLHNVTSVINAELSKHGLTASWTTGQSDKGVSVTCRITHIMGHSEETTLVAPADGSGKKNSIQAIGSTVTYLERYTLFAITGIAGKDQDDDGNGAGDNGPKIPEPTKKEMELTDKIRKALFDTAAEKGLTLKPVEEIAKLIFAFYGKYPTAKVTATTAAAAIIGANRLNSFCNVMEDAA